jgi:serine/threonine protein kinase
VATLGSILAAIVGISGLIGAFLYVAIPRALGRIKNPLLPPEIRVKIAEVQREMADVLKDKSGPFQEMFRFPEHELSEEDVSKVDRSSDVFSLGVVFYELLTGAKPFDAELLGELYLEILTRDPVAPRDRAPGLSDGTQVAVMRMLAKKPDERFPGMEEVLAALAPLKLPNLG